jgi:L(+)-tartrate dehydratase alpha subunit
MISIDVIQKTAEALMEKAAIEIPEDYLDGLKAAAEVEDGDLSSFVLQAMLENYEAAKQDRRAMCGDTGCPRWYVKMGNEARIENGPIALEAALRRATANATRNVPLRPNRVHPLWRTDHDNNVGIGAPRSNMHLNQTGIGLISLRCTRGSVRDGLPYAFSVRWGRGH